MTATTPATVAPLSPTVSKRPPTPLMLDTLADIAREVAREAARGRGERAAYYPVKRSVLGLESRGLITICDNPHGGPDARITITRDGVEALARHAADLARMQATGAAPAPTPTPDPAPTPAPLPAVQVTDPMRAMLVRVGVECLRNKLAKAYAPSNQSLAALERRGALIATPNDCGGIMPRVEFTEIGLATLGRIEPDLAKRVREHIAAAPPAAVQEGGVTLATEIEYDNGLRTSVWLRCAERSAEGPSLCLRYQFQGPGHRGHAQAFCARVSQTFASAADAIKALDAARDFNVCGHSKLVNGVELSFCAMLHGVETWSPDDAGPDGGDDDKDSEGAEVDASPAPVAVDLESAEQSARTCDAFGFLASCPGCHRCDARYLDSDSAEGEQESAPLDTGLGAHIDAAVPLMPGCHYCGEACPRGIAVSTDGDIAHRACVKEYDPETLAAYDRQGRRNAKDRAHTKATATRCYCCDSYAIGHALRDKDGGPCKGETHPDTVAVPACERHMWPLTHSVGFARSGTLCGERNDGDTIDVRTVTCPGCKARIADAHERAKLDPAWRTANHVLRAADTAHRALAGRAA